MSEKSIAINDDLFDDLLMKFYKIKEEMHETFGTIDTLVEAYGNSFVSESNKKLLNEYRIFRDGNYGVLLENLETYIEDLKMARTNYDTFDTELSLQIHEGK